jgi:hypothetical protein
MTVTKTGSWRDSDPQEEKSDLPSSRFDQDFTFKDKALFHAVLE